MKKLIATTLVCTSLGLVAYAQGTVNFQNIAGTAVNAPVELYGTTTKASGYTAALLAGPAGDSLAQLTQIATAAVTSGYFLGGVQTINGIAPGGSAAFVIEVWANTTASFATAKSANALNTWAWSNGGTPLTVTTGNPTTTPAGLPSSLTPLGTTPLTLNAAVPEPSTFALAGLGAAALLLFRRRS